MNNILPHEIYEKPLLHFSILFLLISLCLAFPVWSEPRLDEDDRINIICLKEHYPQVENLREAADGNWYLVLKDGQNILYSSPRQQEGAYTIKESMAEIYPLEPARPDIAPGFAPGRKRPYEFFSAIYGATREDVRKRLEKTGIGNGSINLTAEAARAFRSVAPVLEKIAKEPDKRKLLKSDGGFFWREIAGEKKLSAHSWGIALDLGAAHAPYWRWSKKMPHPMQKSYPGEIVAPLEQAGFIWGGKWDKYDLMHFEYRPELICKARKLRDAGRPR